MQNVSHCQGKNIKEIRSQELGVGVRSQLVAIFNFKQKGAQNVESEEV
jgi:hypothetical protein